MFISWNFACTIVSIALYAAQLRAVEKHALLIGVSNYPNIADRFGLPGAANDVQLMSTLLSEKFAFPTERIRVLSEERGSVQAAWLPTRANIEHEFRRLADATGASDEVVIFMAGHGSQQPDQSGSSETDGLDEIFLPRDVEKWQENARIGAVPNAIIDNEIAVWLKAIQKKNSRVWLILDCCHSGDMTRGVGERERFVDPSDKDGLAIPTGKMAAARSEGANRTEPSRGDSVCSVMLDWSDDFSLTNLAVFSACQSHEKALELPFPENPVGKPYGLLTYSLNSVLSKAKGSLSYREVGRRIQLAYIAAGRLNGPTPMVEGGETDREVLGHQSITRSQIHVALDPNDDKGRTLRIDAGRLHGITLDSVLVVLPAPDQRSDNGPMGHIKVTSVDIASSDVVSCEFGQFSKRPARSLAGGICEIVQVDYGNLRLPVFIDSNDAFGAPLPREILAKMETLVRDLTAEKESLVATSADTSEARWYIRYRNEAIELAPRCDAVGQSRSQAAVANHRILGPFKWDGQLKQSLSTSLNRIARAENLLRLASNSDADATSTSLEPGIQLDIRASILRGGKIIPAIEPVTVRPSDDFDIRVSNKSKRDVDLTVLYVGPQMGIDALFPVDNQNNRIRSGSARDMPMVEILAGPYGRGHFVFLSLVAQGPPLDFVWLVQKNALARGGHSPLDTLLENAVFAEGRTRSADPRTGYRFDILPIEILRTEGE